MSTAEKFAWATSIMAMIEVIAAAVRMVFDVRPSAIDSVLIVAVFVTFGLTLATI